MSNYQYDFTTTIEINGEETEVSVGYNVEPAQRGGWSDPSWDAYADEFEVTLDGKTLELDKETEAIILDRCNDDMENFDYDGD